MSSYCKDCKDRTTDCHVKCFAYNVEQARLKAKKKAEFEEKKKHYDYVGYSRSVSDSLRRRRNEN